MVKSKFACVALLVGIAGLGSTGCRVRAHGHLSVPQPVVTVRPIAVVEVREEPPPPRVWIRDTRPGYVYIQGRWNWDGGRWVWYDGRWETQRSNQIWVDGRWERRGNSHVYVEGRWDAHGGGHVRDHRDDGPRRPDPSPGPRRPDPAPPAPQGGNAGGSAPDGNVRDHRR